MKETKIIVIRYSTRAFRDFRINTHIALTARAFQADKIIFTDFNEELKQGIERVNGRFGSNFEVEFEENYLKKMKELKNEGFKIVHLTMYGLCLKKELKNIKKDGKIAIFVGSEKVPLEVYELADYNISITNQPISEVSALGVFLNELTGGKALDFKFRNRKIEIIGQRKGKKVIEIK